MERRIIYLCLHKRLWQKAGMSKLLNKKTVYRLLGEHYLVPKKLRPVVLAELMDLSILKNKNRTTVEVTRPRYDPEARANELYKYYKLF